MAVHCPRGTGIVKRPALEEVTPVTPVGMTPLDVLLVKLKDSEGCGTCANWWLVIERLDEDRRPLPPPRSGETGKVRSGAAVVETATVTDGTGIALVSMPCFDADDGIPMVGNEGGAVGVTEGIPVVRELPVAEGIPDVEGIPLGGTEGGAVGITE